MKTKLLITLLASCLCALAAWLVHTPKPAQADEVPEKYRDTVRKGLEYLVKQQHKDGHWEGDDGKHPVAMTGLVGLALLMETDRPARTRVEMPIPEVKHLAEIRKAGDWLIAQSDPKRDGLIFSGHASETSRYMEGHGLATIFLAGAMSIETDGQRAKKLTETVVRSLKYTGKAQSSRGGWYQTSKAEGHDFDALLPTVIQIQALQAAENVGVAIPRDVLTDAQSYLLTAMGEHEKDNPPANANRATDTAAALACRYHPSRQGEDKLLEKWWKYCEAQVPVGRDVKLGRDELLHYYYAQAVVDSGARWKKYRPAMFDFLQAKQHKDGSWPGGEGLGVGPVYSTAVWCIILQLDHCSHPSRRREEFLLF